MAKRNDRESRVNINKGVRTNVDKNNSVDISCHSRYSGDPGQSRADSGGWTNRTFWNGRPSKTQTSPVASDREAGEQQ
jgi:hypothetical protein